MYFVYARFKTEMRAYEALEEMYADGEISPCELFGIAKANGIWEIRLKAY